MSRSKNAAFLSKTIATLTADRDAAQRDTLPDPALTANDVVFNSTDTEHMRARIESELRRRDRASATAHQLGRAEGRAECAAIANKHGVENQTAEGNCAASMACAAFEIEGIILALPAIPTKGNR